MRISSKGTVHCRSIHTHSSYLMQSHLSPLATAPPIQHETLPALAIFSKAAAVACRGEGVLKRAGLRRKQGATRL